MVRGKTVLRRIENPTSRQVTFSKRRNGLLKKAFELSVLCEAEVGVIVFSPSGKLYEFTSSSMQKTIERYQGYTKELPTNNKGKENSQFLKSEAVSMTRKIENLESSKRKLLGEDVQSCSIDELQEMENQLEKSLSIIRAKKNELYRDKIEHLKEKERMLLEQNASLFEKTGVRSSDKSTPQPHLQLLPNSQNSQDSEVENEVIPQSQDSYDSEVETELFIGRPDSRRIRDPCAKGL